MSKIRKPKPRIVKMRERDQAKDARKNKGRDRWGCALNSLLCMVAKSSVGVGPVPPASDFEEV